MAKQLEIDWTRARQLMVLASAEIADAVIVEGNTPRKVRAVVLKAVLQAIDHHGRGKAAWVSYETIAREARICLRQAKRAIIALEQESLLVTDTRKCNHYSIVWSELNLRCPSHRQLSPLESAAPDPQPEPSPADSTATERSALRAQRSALATQRSALGTQRSALEGTRTVPEPYMNRSEPPPPTPSQQNGGGGWDLIVEEWRSRISQIRQIAADARAAGESCGDFLARLQAAWEIAVHPANKDRVRKPAGAVVHWLRQGSWPVDGMVDPADREALQAATQRVDRRAAESEWSQRQAMLTQLVKAGRQQGRSDEDIKAAMLRNATPQEVARFGW